MAAPGRLRRAAAAAALLAYATALFATIQFATPNLVDRDGYYHARYAAMLPERGLARDFPWAERTVLGRRFSDKEFLFHAFLAPFAALSPVAGTKAAVVVLDVGIVAAAFLALRSLGVRHPALFAALLLACGNHFLFRLQMARPHLGAVLLAIAGTAAIVTDRRVLAWALGFVFAWAYAAPHLLIFLALLDIGGRASAGGAFEPRTFLATAGGVAAGLILHPYFPNDLFLFYAQDVAVLGQAFKIAPDLGLRLGAEFDPVTTRSVLLTSGGALLAYVGGAAAAIAAPGRPSRKTVSLFVMASGTLVLFLLSAKFVEYFAPLAVIFAASAATDALAGRRIPRVLAAAVLAAALLLHAGAVGLTLAAVRATPPPALEGAARFIDANARPGELVAHLTWADFSTLFHFAPRQRYLTAMDPTFLAVEDPEAARLLEDMRTGRRPIDGPALAGRFGSRFLVLSKERPGPYEEAVFAGLMPLFEDGTGAVFALPEPGGDSGR